jgi:hypothetical protein
MSLLFDIAQPTNARAKIKIIIALRETKSSAEVHLIWQEIRHLFLDFSPPTGNDYDVLHLLKQSDDFLRGKDGQVTVDSGSNFS